MTPRPWRLAGAWLFVAGLSSAAALGRTAAVIALAVGGIFVLVLPSLVLSGDISEAERRERSSRDLTAGERP